MPWRGWPFRPYRQTSLARRSRRCAPPCGTRRSPAARRREEGADAPHVRLRQARAVLYGDGVLADEGEVVALSPRRDLFFGHVGEHLAVLELDDAVAVHFGKLAVVRHHDDQLALGQLFQRFEYLFARVRVESARRFVRHDDLGVFDQRPRDGNALLLPARQGVGLALGKLLQLYLRENVAHLLLVLALAL